MNKTNVKGQSSLARNHINVSALSRIIITTEVQGRGQDTSSAHEYYLKPNPALNQDQINPVSSAPMIRQRPNPDRIELKHRSIHWRHSAMKLLTSRHCQLIVKWRSPRDQFTQSVGDAMKEILSHASAKINQYEDQGLEINQTACSVKLVNQNQNLIRNGRKTIKAQSQS